MRQAWPRGVNRDLEAVAALAAERGLTIGRPFEAMEEIDSTNDAAKRAAKQGAPHGALFVAESQSRGRGRQGRTWIGARGESILASVLLRISCEPRKLPPLALVCGLAVRDAVAKAVAPLGAHAARAAARVMIKWPNDVLIDEKKVAGVLVEAVVAGSKVEAVIVGFGLNVHQRTFDPEIAERATSVALHTESPPDRAVILADVLMGIDRDVSHVAARGLGLVHARITAANALAGRAIRTDEGVSGRVLGIELDGTLRVERDDGVIVRLAAGEVHLTSV